MGGIDDIAQEVDTFSNREHPLVGFNLQTDAFNTFMHDVAYSPQLILAAGENHAVIAVPIEESGAQPVLERMIENHRQQKVAQPLRASQTDTYAFGHHAHEPLQYCDQLGILEYVPDTVYDGLLVHAFIELGDVELVAETCAVGIRPQVTLNIRLKVVHAALFDACGSGADESSLEVFVDY